MATHALAPPIDNRIKLAALWAATLACYLYCDYFALYMPGKLAAMQAGQMGPLGAVDQGTLLGASVLMAVPSLMIALSVLLPVRAVRLTSGVCGAAYTLLLAAIAATADWRFYQFFALIEAALTAYVVWLAWRWPQPQEVHHAH